MKMKIYAQNAEQTLLASAESQSGQFELLEGNWYFDAAIVNMQYLRQTERTYVCPYKGTCYWIDLEAPGVKARNIGWVYPEPAPDYRSIKGRIAFYGRETSGTIAREEAEAGADIR